MKKKILSLILAVVLFIPMSIVKASDITIDQIVARLNENIASGDSFLSKMGENATAEKFGSNSSNIIRVYVSADPDDFYNNYEGNTTSENSDKFHSETFTFAFTDSGDYAFYLPFSEARYGHPAHFNVAYALGAFYIKLYGRNV